MDLMEKEAGDAEKMIGAVKEIYSREAVEFLLPKHYSGRKPQVTKAFGWFDNQGELKAVCTFGKPASPSLCKGLLGGIIQHLSMN